MKFSIVIIPSNHRGEFYRLPTYNYYPKGFGYPFSYQENPEEGIEVISIPSRDVKLYPFMLETGDRIRGGYDEETKTVLLTDNPLFKNKWSKGLAGNYIAFILSMPRKCWDIEEEKGGKEDA
jgi:hypothetical protein